LEAFALNKNMQGISVVRVFVYDVISIISGTKLTLKGIMNA